MKVTKNGFMVKIEGKCLNNQDIITMWNFVYSIKGIVKQYAKDNKTKISEASKIVETVLYKNAMKK